MENASIAALFDEIADLQEIAGENPFQSRAYRKAAEAIVGLDGPIEDKTTAELRAVPGLGAATTDKIREYLATGRIAVLERLRDEYPRGLLELRRVPGLGPKKVAQLYRERGISSIESLQEAIAAGEFESLAGFGPKAVANIELGLKKLALVGSQLALIDALPLAEALTRQITAASGATRLEVAGDLRCGCDSIGALSWVAQSDSPAAALSAFAKMPQVVEIISESAQQAVVKVRPGLEATLTVAPRQSFGSAWFFATGSPQYIEEAERRAAGRSIKLAEFSEEAELYAAMDCPYLPAELREGAAAWDIKLQQRLLEASDIKGDLHAHSTWSDGVDSIRSMVAAARERGYSYHAITDHSRALAMANGLTAERLREQAREIEEVRAEFDDMLILRGVECDILRDGSLDLDDEILHELDWVVASVHSAFNLDQATQTARIVRAIAHPAVDCIGHPTGRIVGVRPPYEVDVPALIAAAAATATALEINASQRLDLKDEYVAQARTAGVLIAVNTDAHSTRMLDNIGVGITTARRACCAAPHVLNTKTVAELKLWLQRPQSHA
jgi:DNA polymerase (family 10)